MFTPKKVLLHVLGTALAVAAWVGSPAPGDATVSVSPPDTSVSVGDEVTVRIVTGPVADLKALQFVFEFDPAIVQLVDIQPGDVLTSTASFAAFQLPDYTPPADTAWYDAAVLVGTGSGPGILAFLKFQVATLIAGATPVRCRLVDFRDSENVSTHPACEEGMVRVFGPVQAESATWGRLKVLYR
jgi:hypothetical protein